MSPRLINRFTSLGLLSFVRLKRRELALAALGGIALLIGGYFLAQSTARRDRLVRGIAFVTGYRTTLSAAVAASDATIQVASIRDRGGNDIDFSLLGGRAFFTIEPGTSREETVMCTGRSGSSWTGCIRGLPFQGGARNALVASTTLQFAHNAGTAFVHSNSSQVYEELVDKFTNNPTSEDYLGGTYVYTSNTPIYFGNGVNSGRKCLFVRTGLTTSSLPYLCFDTAGPWFTVSNDGVSNFAITPTSSIVTASSSAGLFLTNNFIGVNTFSTSGLKFLNPGEGDVYVATSTASGGNAIGIDSLGLLLRLSSSAGGLRFDSVGALQFSSAELGSVTATSTSATSTFYNLAIGNQLGSTGTYFNVASNIRFLATSTIAHYAFATSSFSPASLGTSTIITVDLPGGTLGPNDRVEISFHGSSQVVQGRLCIAFGASCTTGTQILYHNLASDTAWSGTAGFQNLNSQSAQRAWGSSGGSGRFYTNTGTGSVDLSAPQTLTVQVGKESSAQDVTLTAMDMKIITGGR